MSVNTQRTSGGSVTEGLPKAQYLLIDKDGKPFNVRGWPISFETAKEAADQAKRLWPDQEQDAGRFGKGWDIEVIR